MSWVAKLKERWGVGSGWQVVAILLVFAFTGMSALYVKKFLYFLVGITDETEAWIRISYRVLATFIAYQFLLLGYGWLFGQFKFFWEFEKKMINRFRGKTKEK